MFTTGKEHPTQCLSVDISIFLALTPDRYAVKNNELANTEPTLASNVAQE